MSKLTPFYGIHLRRVVLVPRRAYLRVFRNSHGDMMPVFVSMPCGELMEVYTWDSIPLVDTPCPCGNPRHWLVKWENEWCRSCFGEGCPDCRAKQPHEG